MNNHKPYIYDFNDCGGKTDLTNLFVTKLMETHSGQCRSMPLYYKILANEIGAKAYIAYAPNHMFIRHRDETGSRWMNVELTNHSMPRDIFIIESMGITERAIQAGVYMRPCDDRDIIIVLLTELAYEYIRKIGTVDHMVWSSLNKALHYDPNNLHALMWLYKSLRIVGDEHRKLYPDNATVISVEMHNIITQLMEIDRRIESLGYVEMPRHLYDEWQKAIGQEKSRRAASEKQ